MKVAILLRRCYPPGGSEESMLFAAKKLADNHTVRVFGYVHEEDHSSEIIETKPYPKGFESIVGNTLAYQLQKIQIPTGFKKEIEEYKPDVILTQHEQSYFAAFYKKRTGTPFITFLRDESMRSSANTNQNRIAQKVLGTAQDILYYPFNKYTLEASNLVIANSKHIRRKYEEKYDLNDIKVVYPFVERSEYESDSGGSILHVGTKQNKGIEITLQVAQRMENQHFIIVGRDPPEVVKESIEHQDNITYRGYVDDMKKVYSDSKLVIYPSTWDEPYGRVPIEAGFSGIPTVCSGTGGLPEAVGHQAFIADSNSPDDYVNQIEEILRNYQIYSNIAKWNSNLRCAQIQFDDFERNFEMVTPAPES